MLSVAARRIQVKIGQSAAAEMPDVFINYGSIKQLRIILCASTSAQHVTHIIYNVSPSAANTIRQSNT